MLCSLSVRNVLLIGRLDIEFGAGLNVLTGETGAGKSILLDSVGFALGRHGRSNLNSGQGGPSEVSASFDVSGNRIVRAVLDELDIPCGDELFLRRVLLESGRTSSFVNDRRCTVEALGRIGEALVEMHGQSDTGGLSNPGTHRRLLDQFAGHDLLVSGARRAWRDWRLAEDELSRTVERLNDADREREYSEHAVRELEDLGPKAGEDAELDHRRSTMKLFARFQENLAKAESALGAEGADGCINDALRWLESASRLDEAGIGETSSALDRALLELSEAQRLLDGIRRNHESEPREIEEVEERLFAIRALARKHSVQPDKLEEVAHRLTGNLQDADRLKEEAKRLEAAVDERRSEYGRISQQLSVSRSSAAGKLDAAMQRELAPLRLGRTRFTAEVIEESCGPEGADGVAFNVTTNPSLPPGPISSIASGGELSRFMLALKVCLMSDSDGICAVFDEIDRGIGGATANAVGRRLRSLATGSQVLVVTHSPQVAAMGHHHWRIEKRDGAGGMQTQAIKLDEAARNNEIARMLAGESITEEARAAAAALLSRV